MNFHAFPGIDSPLSSPRILASRVQATIWAWYSKSMYVYFAISRWNRKGMEVVTKVLRRIEPEGLRLMWRLQGRFMRSAITKVVLTQCYQSDAPNQPEILRAFIHWDLCDRRRCVWGEKSSFFRCPAGKLDRCNKSPYYGCWRRILSGARDHDMGCTSISQLCPSGSPSRAWAWTLTHSRTLSSGNEYSEVFVFVFSSECIIFPKAWGA